MHSIELPATSFYLVVERWAALLHWAVEKTLSKRLYAEKRWRMQRLTKTVRAGFCGTLLSLYCS